MFQVLGPLSGLLTGLLFLAYIGLIVFIIVKFYQALNRIGEELSFIRSILQQRLPPPSRPDSSSILQQ